MMLLNQIWLLSAKLRIPNVSMVIPIIVVLILPVFKLIFLQMKHPVATVNVVLPFAQLQLLLMGL